MIAVWIILGVIALILLILILPVHLHAKFDGQLKVLVRILFFKYTLYPFPAQNRIGKTAKKRAVKLKDNEISKTEDLLKDEGISTLISYYAELAKILASSSKRLLRALTVDKLKLNIIVASEEAAQTAIDYGQVCSIVYPCQALLESILKVRRRFITIEPDFLLEKGHVDGEIKVHILPFKILWALLLLFVQYLGNTTTTKTVRQ